MKQRHHEGSTRRAGLALALLALALSTAPPVAAGMGKGNGEIGFDFGVTDLDTDYHHDDAAGVTIRGGYFLTDVVEIEGQLGSALVDSVLGSLESRNVDLTMPKWEFESSFSLASALQALGMPSAFSPDTADFSGMTSGEQLFISDVIHQAFVSVDEEGTEAAAATAVMMAGSAMPPEPVALSLALRRPLVRGL